MDKGLNPDYRQCGSTEAEKQKSLIDLIKLRHLIDLSRNDR